MPPPPATTTATLPLPLQVRDFYEQRYKYEVEGMDFDRLLLELPNDIGRRIQKHVYTEFWKLDDMEFWRALQFHKLPQEQKELFCSLLDPVVVRAGDVVYNQGADDSAIYFIKHGKIKIAREVAVRAHHHGGRLTAALIMPIVL